jgi:MSHA biogenesis protein MshK
MTRAGMLLLGFCLACPALAQRPHLVDPTRPPSVATASPQTGEAAPQRGPELQSVLISPTRRVAVISGTTVSQGGKYGEATVARIDESSVLLQYAKGHRTLHLLPGVTKRERRAAARGESDRGPPR